MVRGHLVGIQQFQHVVNNLIRGFSQQIRLGSPWTCSNDLGLMRYLLV